MDSQGKRTLIALVACGLLFFGWSRLMEVWYPPVPASQPTSGEVEIASSAPGSTSQSSLSAAPAASQATANALSADNDESAQAVVLGDDRHNDIRTNFINPFSFGVRVNPRGAGVEWIHLSQHRNHVPKDKRNPTHDPYDLMSPLEAGKFTSFEVEKIELKEEQQTIDLSTVRWGLTKRSDEKGEAAVLQTVVKLAGQPTIEIRKTYRLDKGSDHLAMTLELTNLSPQPRRVVVTQRGPIGFKNEDIQRENRRLACTLVEIEKDDKNQNKVDRQGKPLLKVTDGPHPMRQELTKAEDFTLELQTGDKHFLWNATGNKYFGCIMTWLPLPDSALPYADYLAKVFGRLYLPLDTAAAGDLMGLSDLSFQQVLAPTAPIAPGKSIALHCEIYCGPKDDAYFAKLPPEIKARQYERISNPDRAGCTFQAIQTLMIWLIGKLYGLFGNYGLAIIGLVFIVRLILHPVTKSGQVSMMRMQKRMAELKPKMDAVQEQYKNDRAKLNEETMKLYREHGVNPASSMFGCLPMLLQLPIWAGLWTSLNTNVHLRHQPFFWWIKDLSIPDGLYTPETPWNLNIPLIGMVTGTIHAFNLLPIIMAITMYAQQKFMQKITRPATPPPPKLDAEGRPLPDPMAQQQKMMNFMLIFFGAMFYNMPAGLNVYILCSNLLGMAEQYRIKKHIKGIDERGEFTVPKPDAPKSPSWFERLQRRAEELRQNAPPRDAMKPRKQKKPPRF